MRTGTEYTKALRVRRGGEGCGVVLNDSCGLWRWMSGSLEDDAEWMQQYVDKVPETDDR